MVQNCNYGFWYRLVLNIFWVSYTSVYVNKFRGHTGDIVFDHHMPKEANIF